MKVQMKAAVVLDADAARFSKVSVLAVLICLLTCQEFDCWCLYDTVLIVLNCCFELYSFVCSQCGC